MSPLCSYRFSPSASITEVVTISPFHYVTCLPYSSNSRTVVVVLPQHGLFYSHSSNSFIISTVPFRENTFFPHSSSSQITVLSFYHHDRYLAFFQQYLSCFSRTGTSQISLQQRSYIFQRNCYLAYCSTKDILHIFQPLRDTY